MSQTMSSGGEIRIAEQSRGRVAGALAQLLDPEIGHDVVALGLINGIEMVQNAALIELGVTTPCPEVAL